MNSFDTGELERNLLAAPATESGGVEIYSGVARLARTVWASEVKPRAAQPTTAIMFTHPTSNFLGHYALEPLARRGFAAIGLTTRYVGNDSNLRTENCLLDIGAMVAHLRQRGYDKVILIGNSGGASIAPYYQAQAENPTVTRPPGGGPDLTKVTLPTVDGVGLLMAHSGRARLVTDWLDPAIIDERSPLQRDPALDMYDKRNGPPYSDKFVARYRLAQITRNRRISDWAEQMLRFYETSGPDGLDDVPFVVHGTYADLRSLDGALEPSDRPIGVSLWGAPEVANFMPAAIARYTTARSWLNQWSIDHALGDALRWLPSVHVPVHIIYGTADTAAHPSHASEMYAAVTSAPRALTAIRGAGHYFEGQPQQLEDAIDAIADWVADPIGYSGRIGITQVNIPVTTNGGV
jgi:pimeloyl-ACP methyl ester carboxylesterase